VPHPACRRNAGDAVAQPHFQRRATRMVPRWICAQSISPSIDRTPANRCPKSGRLAGSRPGRTAARHGRQAGLVSRSMQCVRAALARADCLLRSRLERHAWVCLLERERVSLLCSL
jgi:hypothetical protein